MGQRKVPEQLLRTEWIQEVDWLSDTIAGGITFIDYKGAILWQNTVARRIYLTLLESPGTEQTLETLLQAPLKCILTGKKVQESMVQVMDAHGKGCDYLVTAYPLRPIATPPGSSQDAYLRRRPGEQPLSGAVVIWHAMNEGRLRESEQQAREHADYLEAILEAMTDGVFVYDQQGRIVKMNTAAQTILALTAPPGTAILPVRERHARTMIVNAEGQLLSPERWPMVRILQGERFTPDQAAEMRMPKLDGGVLDINFTGGPIRDASGQIIGAVAIARDITKQKQAEREREQQAQQLRLQAGLIEQAHDAIIVRDPQDRIISWNRGAQELYGWTEEEVRGKVTHTLLQTRFPQSCEDLDALLERQGQWEGELIHRCYDGRQMIVDSRQILVRDERGNATAILEINRDITERRRLEQVEREARAEREAQFKEAERLKDEFIGIATHELRDPLAVLKGYTQMLLMQSKRGKGPEFTESQKQMLQEIDNSINSMVELANDLLDVTRLQAGELVLQFEPTDLVALIRRVTERLQMTTMRHTLSIESTLSSLPLSLDVRRMEQVFSNVIGNAIKYSPDGGDVEIAIREARKAHEVVISIRDHGIGIPLHEQGRIFGRFARATNAGTSKIGGTGLGLYLCRELVERHAGRIWFESVQGHGSTFFIVLPLTSEFPGNQPL